MTNGAETTDVNVNGPAVVEIDAEKIAQIIFDHCHTSEARAARAAKRDPRLPGRGSPKSDQGVMSLDDQLAELWAAGATFPDMGLKLGESRNVIAGRIDRLRKAGDPRFKPRESKPREPQRRVVKPPDEHVGDTQPLPLPPASPKPRLLVDLAPTGGR